MRARYYFNKHLGIVLLLAAIVVFVFLVNENGIALAQENPCIEGTMPIYNEGGELVSCEELIGDLDSCPQGAQPGYLEDGTLAGCFEHEMITFEDVICDPSYGDADEDGLADNCDPDPTNPDADGDLFPDSTEVYVGTDALVACGPHAWPPDFNGDISVDVTDALEFLAKFPDDVDELDERQYDFEPNGVIDVTDALIFLALFPSDCTTVAAGEQGEGEVALSSMWNWNLQIPIIEVLVQQHSTKRWCVWLLGCSTKYWLHLDQHFYCLAGFEVIGPGDMQLDWGANWPYYVGDTFGEDVWLEAEWIHYQDHFRTTANMNLWVFPELTFFPVPIWTRIDAHYCYFEYSDLGF